MLLTVFENNLFLQAIGWAIISSLWQTAVLWLLYQLIITVGDKLSALFRYYLSLTFLFIASGGFLISIVTGLASGENPEATGLTAIISIPDFLGELLSCISVLYFILLPVYLVRFANGMRLTGKLQQTGFSKAPVHLRLFANELSQQIGIKKKITVWLSEKVDVPSVAGFFKPMILLPVAAVNQLSTEQTEAIILHELAHIKRNDYLVNIIQCMVELMLFFNPFARLLGKSARLERENCCDDWVLNYEYNKHAYAEALLLLEQNRLQPALLTMTATSGKKSLLARVKRLFNTTPYIGFNAAQRWKLAATTISLSAIILLLIPALHTNHNQYAISSPLQLLPLKGSMANQTGYTSDVPAKIAVAGRLSVKIKIPQKVNAHKLNTTPELINDQDYQLALINDELLNQSSKIQNLALQAADKEATLARQMIVKVEEEISGQKDKQTYLVELNSENGQVTMKPLLALKTKAAKLTSTKAKRNIKARASSKIKSTSGNLSHTITTS